MLDYNKSEIWFTATVYSVVANPHAAKLPCSKTFFKFVTYSSFQLNYFTLNVFFCSVLLWV